MAKINKGINKGATEVPNAHLVELSEDQRKAIVVKKATCPFLASAVKSGELSVRNSATRPLAAIDDVETLGNSGGGDLGSRVLTVFAKGNHSRVPGPNGRFDELTPKGMFSLDLAGSQGAHPGHSGILLGDPTRIDTGRFGADDFDRLAQRAGKNGHITADAIGDFISENLARDAASRVMPIGRVARDLFGLVDEIGDSLCATLLGRRTERDEVELIEKLTMLAGADNLIGSAGEYGLLFAFLANRPDASRDDDDLYIRLDDVELMMAHHQFPIGWKTWPKKATTWVRATTKLTASATAAHLKRSFTS
jgi:hypothetical protein